ncbi:tetratricopeptide repeat protein [Tellurirhabdus bombi]|uniref:tetratricopeptide repeat protein n=1 Tax=Tellurirhabdus bombi TaxID=2907205 RepID=UPI001F4857AC|nr:tetratricopeptide repeat protein [Tellurirhabdus bombi]
MKKIFFFLLFLLSSQLVSAQITTDAAMQQTILKALDHMYNYQFDASENYQRQIRAKYPQHPVVPILRAMQLYWEYLPLRDNKAVTAQYVQLLNQGLALTEKRLKEDKNDPESVFFALTAHSYLAAKYNFDDETMKAVGEAKKAYTYLKQGFDLMERNPEFYFTTGLYNYYVERYPQDHSIVKPVMWFFQSGDMALGIRQMETAIRRGVFTRVETAFYLMHIYLEHENQPGRAAALVKNLADKYPNNPLFSMRSAEALLLAGRTAEALPYLERIQKMPQKVLDMPTKALEGLYYERTSEEEKALAAYQAAIKLPFYAEFTKEFQGHAYAGLARLAARSGDKAKAKSYYKKTLDIAEYKTTKREAKAFLKL